MDKEFFRANEGKISLFGGLFLILLAVFVSFVHIPVGIFLFAGGSILLMSLIKEKE